MTGKIMLVSIAAATLASCGGGDKDQRKLEAAMDSMSRPRDSAVRSLDSTGANKPIDTTKLGAAKTESILTKARKRP